MKQGRGPLRKEYCTAAVGVAVIAVKQQVSALTKFFCWSISGVHSEVMGSETKEKC
jgi:hypothetical protein